MSQPDIDVVRVRDALARDYDTVDPRLLDEWVRAEFAARSSAPLQE